MLDDLGADHQVEGWHAQPGQQLIVGGQQLETAARMGLARDLNA